jgi:Gas vesicle synthesis protein GvpL/GvpF/Lsr2
MATVTEITLTCDVCGEAKDVKTWTFGLDGKAYEIDLCRKDGNGLGSVTAGYIAKARKVTVGAGRRHRGSRRRVRGATAASSARKEAKTSRLRRQAAVIGGAKAGAAGSERAARAGLLQPHNADGASAQAARGRQQEGVYVYGILPADIEVTDDIPGVGKHPGLLRVVRSGGLAALISEVDVSGRLGSADDLRTYREILDATAVEVPVLPLRFGTVLASEDAVAEELLTVRHDEFTAALEQLEGRVEFQVKGRYVQDAVLGEVLSQNKKAARLRDAIQGEDLDAARKARLDLGRFIDAAVTARREQDARALRQAMERLCVASAARELAHELDAVDIAFLVALTQEREVEEVIEDLAREWEGRIEVRLLGPMAVYDFPGTAPPDN